MNKKNKVKLISISGIIIILLIILGFLLNIRGEFSQYLNAQYPEQSFKVGFTKIDIVYGNYYAPVDCLTDGTHFVISKGFKTKYINTDYIQSNSITQYNSKIRDIFDSSDIRKDIVDVTGGGKTPYSEGAYELISIHLINNTDPSIVAKRVLDILKDKNITAERIIFKYEKDNLVYELSLSSNDYNLTEKDIKARIRKIK
jgi:hypothetical protein